MCAVWIKKVPRAIKNLCKQHSYSLTLVSQARQCFSYPQRAPLV